jgi:hypothetical protein
MAGAGFGAYDGDESTWGFKATPDGKVVLGNTSDDVIQVTGSMEVNGNVYMTGSTGTAATYLYHGTDTDTYMQFENDAIHLVAGSRQMIKMEEASQDKLVINNGGMDIDFHVKGENEANLIRTIASTDRVGIGTNSPSVLLDVAGDAHIAGQFARGTAAVNLGSGTTSTLDPGTEEAGTLLVTASSITSSTASGVHTCTLADGTVTGQIVTIVMVTTFLAGDEPGTVGLIIIAPTSKLNSSYGIVTFTGEAYSGTPIGSTAVLIWTGSAWAILSTRRGGGSP